MKTFLRLLRFLRPFIGWVMVSVLLGTATILSSVGLLETSAYIIASAALHPSIAVLQVAIVGVRFFGISRGVFRYLERLISHSVNFRLLSALRTWFYRAVEPLAPALLQSYHSGDLLGRAVSDIETLENFYVRAVAPPVVALVITLGMGWFVGLSAPSLAGILVGGLILSGICVPLLTHLLNRASGKSFIATRSLLNTALVDSIQGMEDLLAFGRQEDQVQKIHFLSSRLEKTQKRSAQISAASNALNLLLTHLTLWCSLLVSIPLVGQGKLDGVFLAVVSLLILSSFEAVTPLGTAAQHLESSLQAARRLFEIADLPVPKPSAQEVSIPSSPPGVSPALSIRGLSFRYAPESSYALEGIDFDLPPGQKIAVVGSSGAGKSTLFNLLLRFWDYDCGSITLNGVELRQIHPADVRRQFGVITQSAYIFNDSLRGNLQLAAPHAPDDELRQVLYRVQLGSWLEGLPTGLDTWLG